MRFHFSKHVQEELGKRKISRTLIEQVLQSPEQKVPGSRQHHLLSVASFPIQAAGFQLPQFPSAL